MAAASANNPGAASRVRQWLVANLASSWFLAAPLVSLAATYAPRRLFLTYFNLFLRRHARRLLNAVDPYVSVDVLECPALARFLSSLQPLAETDTTYEEVVAYLSAAAARSQDARELRAEAARHGDGLVVSARDGQDVADEFRGATLWWSSVLLDADHAGGLPPSRSGGDGQSRRCQRLTFHKRHRALVIDEYLPHVRRRGRDVLVGNRRRRLYTNNRVVAEYSSPYHKSWSYVNFSHPTTFDTLAMEPARKKEIMDDLDAFRSSGDFYPRAGKPWKRGYLLYGPPGTGKSTMIAAMGNHLGYDVYDVELTVVRNNNDLRRLLIETTGKSIIVIEDIDCSLDLTGDRRAAGKAPPPATVSSSDRNGGCAVTLSGLLNFIDGLWSACGGERVVVFTTNHVDKLDPALIRRGRMDMHIEMSYCGFEAFKTLAKNYLGVDEHTLFGDVEELLREVQITPADVAECLMTAKRAGRGDDSSMEFLIEELKKKREEARAAADAAAAAAAAKAEEQKTAEANVSKTDKCEERTAEEGELKKKKKMKKKREEAKEAEDAAAAAAKTTVKVEKTAEANVSETEKYEERRAEEEVEEEEELNNNTNNNKKKKNKKKKKKKKN